MTAGMPAALRRDRPAGYARVTREGRLPVALDLLASVGVEAVKVAVIGKKRWVSRFSFYWYFANRRDLRDALTRARILYFMQIGYNDAELHEPMEERLELLPNYLAAVTGRQPRAAEISEFTRYVRNIQEVSGDE